MPPHQSTDIERPKRARRADAQRNYARLVAVARAATAELGERIVLEDIAREAGVAIGTLYRHFPTREDLLAATFVDEAEQLRAMAEDLADAPDPFQALELWLKLQLEYGARAKTLGAWVLSNKIAEGSEMHDAYAAMVQAGEQLLRHAKAAKAARADVELGNVLRIVWGIVLTSGHGDTDPGELEPMLDVVIAGIRA